MADKITPETSLGKLAPSVVNEVIRGLQINENWKRAAAHLTRRNGTLMFNTMDVEILSTYGPEATKKMFRNLLTEGYTVSWLMRVMSQAELYLISDYLAELVSGGSQSVRPKKPAPDIPPPIPPGRPPARPPPIQHTSSELRHFPYSKLEGITNMFDKRPKSEGGNCIGEGGYGHVFYACTSNQELAIKKLHDKEMVARKDFDNEKETMSRLSHENILRLLGYSEDGECICLVYPYMSNGSLEDCLACKWTKIPLGIQKRIHVAYGLAAAIKYLHTYDPSAPLIHRDIKSANVLMDENHVPKLGDFGIARESKALAQAEKTSARTEVIIGTRAYMAPERLLYFKYSQRSDVYSYGVILLELLTGLKAYDGDREEPCLSKHVEEECADMSDKIKMLDGRVEDWPVASAQALYNLAARCLEMKPDHRPEMQTVLKEVHLL